MEELDAFCSFVVMSCIVQSVPVLHLQARWQMPILARFWPTRSVEMRPQIVFVYNTRELCSKDEEPDSRAVANIYFEDSRSSP